MSNQFIK